MAGKDDPVADPMIARDATYYRAPDALRERVRAGLAAAGRERRVSMLPRLFSMGAAFAVVAFVSWNLALRTAMPGEEDVLAREVVTAHVRSLMSEGHLNDVASSDQHTVKPWFSGKLDFAPPVQDLANAGFTLTGGRLDYLDARAVAALTYKYRQHVVNLFVWPAAGAKDAEPVALSRQGYSILHWERAGMRYWAVADVSPAQLAALAEALKK
ncbi:MAG: anti-sigma factor family protein [Usitatibacter sp.]